MTSDEQPMPENSDPFDVGVELEISALANDQIIHASPTISIREAAAMMDAEGIGLLVLKDDGKMTGVVSERDVLKAVGAGTDLDATAASVGNGRFIQRATSTSTVGDVSREMMENYIRHVLIVDDGGEPTGIVSIRDLLAVLAG